MSIEDGMRKATENLDKAAEAAPTSKLVDDSEFGMKDEAAAQRSNEEEDTRNVKDSHDKDSHSESGD